MIRLFIFDIGDVLLMGCRRIRDMADELEIDQNEFLADYRLWNAALMEGFVSVEDYYSHIENKFSKKVVSNLFLDNYSPRINEPIIGLIRRLRERGCRVVFGSNTFKCYDDWNLEHIPHFYSIADGKYFSNEMHSRKPEESFFRYILDKEDVKAEEAVFIDDRKENVDAAARMGIHSFLYDEAISLEEAIIPLL